MRISDWSSDVCSSDLAEEHREPGLYAGCDQAVGEREVAGDVAIGARRHRSRLDLILDDERLGGLAEVPTQLDRLDVGFLDSGHLGEMLRQDRRRVLCGQAVHPLRTEEGSVR